MGKGTLTQKKKNLWLGCSRVKSALGHGSSLCWNTPTGLYLIKLREQHGEVMVIGNGRRAAHFKCVKSRLEDWESFLFFWHFSSWTVFIRSRLLTTPTQRKTALTDLNDPDWCRERHILKNFFGSVCIIIWEIHTAYESKNSKYSRQKDKTNWF